MQETLNRDSFVDGHWSNNPLGENADELFSNMIKNPNFKRRFYETSIELAEKVFRYEDIEKKLYEMASVYEKQVIQSQKRFRGDYAISGYKEDGFNGIYDKDIYWQEITVISEFYRLRPSIIIEYLNLHIPNESTHSSQNNQSSDKKEGSM